MKYYFIRLLLMGLTSLLLLSFITSGIVFASSNNWSEVTRFTGSGSEMYTTDYYTCEHVEWRIKWEYLPHSQYSNLTIFELFTYPQGENASFVDFVMKTGSNDTSGASYIHDNVEGYTIIIEQDLNSIPEFPSWIIVPLFLTTTVLALVFRKRLFRRIS
jgi:hypothetical protein